MTTTAPRRRRSTRWLRAVIPFGVLALVWLTVGVAHAVQEPDLDDPGTLSPTGTGPHGSSRLAEMLTAKGIRIDRVTSSLKALQAAAEGDATLFVPTPDYLAPSFLERLPEIVNNHRVVLVQPGIRTLLFAPLPIFPTGDRWATSRSAPQCGTAYATRAGTAAVHNSTYIIDNTYDTGFTTSVDCYAGGLVGVRVDATEAIYVGASDPFRNDRIDEVGNAALATALLSDHRRVIWVDVHAAEPLPRAQVQPPSLPRYDRDDQDRSATGFPIIDAFPGWLWAALLLGAVAAILFALAAARRLGPPVAEPLPVLVPAAESVTGRGRLYQRIGAREASLQALRGAAIVRLARVLNPFGTTNASAERDLLVPGPAAEELVRQVAARTGVADHLVRAILYGPPPTDDEGLLAAVDELDTLVAAVVAPRMPTPAVQPQGGTP